MSRGLAHLGLGHLALGIDAEPENDSPFDARLLRLCGILSRRDIDGLGRLSLRGSVGAERARALGNLAAPAYHLQ